MSAHTKFQCANCGADGDSLNQKINFGDTGVYECELCNHRDTYVEPNSIADIMHRYLAENYEGDVNKWAKDSDYLFIQYDDGTQVWNFVDPVTGEYSPVDIWEQLHDALDAAGEFDGVN